MSARMPGTRGGASAASRGTAALYLEHASALNAYVIRKLSSACRAARRGGSPVGDLVQDVFLRQLAADGEVALRGGRRTAANLRTIARNLFLDGPCQKRFRPELFADELHSGALEALAGSGANAPDLARLPQYLERLPPPLTAINEARFVAAPSKAESE